MNTPPITPRQEATNSASTAIDQVSQNWKNHRYTLIGTGSVAAIFAISALSGGPLPWIATASLLAVTAIAYFLFLLFSSPEESQPLTNRETASLSSAECTPPELLSRKTTEDSVTPIDITFFENLRALNNSPTSDPLPMDTSTL